MTTMRVIHKCYPTIQDGDEFVDEIFTQDDDAAVVTLDGFQEAVSHRVTIGATETLALPLDEFTTVRGFWMKGNKDFSIALNGGAAISIKRGVVGPLSTDLADTARLMMEAEVSSISVIAGVDGLKLQYVVYGDPVA